MFGERRRHKRELVNRWARIEPNDGTSTRDCLVVDLSISGARLICEMGEIPPSFALQIPGDSPIREECRIVWQIGTELGVEFVTKEERRQQTIKIVQAEARAAFNNLSPENMNKSCRESINAYVELFNKSVGLILRSLIRPKARTRPPL